MNTSLFRTTLQTPIGTLRIDCDAWSVLAIRFPGDADGESARECSTPTSQLAEDQLRRYFDGALKTFDLPLAPQGTPFQRAVWAELARIPFGTTISYRDLAERIGTPNAVRAVGSANASNPIPIILPCHRVIGRDGSLRGFRGGLTCKSWLLTHEGAMQRRESRPHSPMSRL